MGLAGIILAGLGALLTGIDQYQKTNKK